MPDSKLSYEEQRALDFPEHPDGARCRDCFWWTKRCKPLIQCLTGDERTCDFSPSKFRRKT